MTWPHWWKPPPGGKWNPFFHHAFNSSCEALGNSVFNCYRALWAGTDRYGVPAFLSFSLFLERTRTFYSILGLFKVYLEFLQHTGSILELFTAYWDFSWICRNRSCSISLCDLWLTPVAKLHYPVCTWTCGIPVPHKTLRSKAVLRIKCARKAIKKKSHSSWMWMSKPGWCSFIWVGC